MLVDIFSGVCFRCRVSEYWAGEIRGAEKWSGMVQATGPHNSKTIGPWHHIRFSTGRFVWGGPQAFICHFYNVYFAHTAGGRMIGKKVTLPPSEKMTKYWVVHGIMSQHCFGKHNLHSIGTFRCLMPSNPQACICILYWIWFIVPFFLCRYYSALLVRNMITFRCWSGQFRSLKLPVPPLSRII